MTRPGYAGTGFYTMRTAFAILFFLFCSVFSKAQVQQSIMFEKTWGPQLGDLIFYADELPNGNVNLFGWHGSIGVDRSHIYMSQIDKQGNLLWDKELGYVDVAYIPGTVIKTKAGNYLITGSAGFSGSSDVFVFLIDNTGNVIFENFYDGGMYDGGQTACETDDSCYMLAVGLNLPFSHSSPTLLKIDAQGNEIWRKRQDSLSDHFAYFIRLLPSGGYLITGEAGTASYIAEYQSNGDLNWIKYPIGGNSTPSCLFLSQDNSFSVPFRENNSTLWKNFDENGDLLNERIYDFPLRFTAINGWNNYSAVDPRDSSYIITTPIYCSGCNYSIMTIDEDQDTHFQLALTGNDINYKSIYYSIRTTDGGFLSVGANSPPNTGGYYYIVKFGADGRYQPEDFSGTVNAYPNPSPDGNITLGFDMKNDETVHEIGRAHV